LQGECRLLWLLLLPLLLVVALAFLLVLHLLLAVWLAVMLGSGDQQQLLLLAADTWVAGKALLQACSYHCCWGPGVLR
jgi:hypothetical protein